MSTGTAFRGRSAGVNHRVVALCGGLPTQVKYRLSSSRAEKCRGRAPSETPGGRRGVPFSEDPLPSVRRTLEITLRRSAGVEKAVIREVLAPGPAAEGDFYPGAAETAGGSLVFVSHARHRNKNVPLITCPTDVRSAQSDTAPCLCNLLG